jgi:catechol 2,3-dioxygenase-like lactoylglutathione lyase family enzyme
VPVTAGFNHVATLTPDLNRLVRFYTDAFGADLVSEMAAQAGRPRMAILDLGGGASLNAFEAGADDIIGERRRQGGRGAIDHFALAVPDHATLVAMRERLQAAGAEVGEVQRLGDEWSLFFRDPDGMELEVCCHIG